MSKAKKIAPVKDTKPEEKFDYIGRVFERYRGCGYEEINTDNLVGDIESYLEVYTPAVKEFRDEILSTLKEMSIQQTKLSDQNQELKKEVEELKVKIESLQK